MTIDYQPQLANTIDVLRKRAREQSHRGDARVRELQPEDDVGAVVMKAAVALVVLAGVAHADGWKVKTNTGLKLPTHNCGEDVQKWIATIAGQRPTVTLTHELVALELGKSLTISDRALVTPDVVWAFWDAPPWSDQGATLMVRLHPKPGKTAAIEILIVQRHSITDRGDACYVEWQGEAERVP